MAEPVALYIHFPFCARKCAYCDFNSVVADDDLRAAYLAALGQQITQGRLRPRDHDGEPPADRSVTSIYLGGGTPTLYRPQALVGILDAVRARFSVQAGAEITCEANPGTISLDDLAELRGAGVTRLSIGAQSFVDAELSLLGRIHTAAQAEEAVEAARQVGFASLSIDLIRALPGQTSGDWKRVLQTAIAHRPDHLSCYGLSIEEGTVLAGMVGRGELQAAGPGRAAALFVRTHEALVASGYTHYELSSYALPGHQCRHNLTYWRNEEYLGFGAGAWSYVGGVRWRWTREPARYVRDLQAGAAAAEEQERLSASEAAGETAMLRLRLAEGFDMAELSERFGLDCDGLFASAVSRAEAAGLICRLGRVIAPTLRGMLLNDELGALFVSPETTKGPAGGTKRAAAPSKVQATSNARHSAGRGCNTETRLGSPRWSDT